MFEDSFLAFGRTPAAVPFGASDGGLTDLFFLICCQDDRIHLHVLARLCLMATRTRLLEALRAAPDAAAISLAIRDSEADVIRSLDG
jgi:mannitol/fructose-specific phosphotransferase system IIA component (Ntr-type)